MNGGKKALHLLSGIDFCCVLLINTKLCKIVAVECIDCSYG